MVDLDTIQKMWEEDAKIDPDNLDIFAFYKEYEDFDKLNRQEKIDENYLDI